MGGPVITLALRSQEDVLLTRRRARDLAGFLQLGAEAQSRLATAVWEVARLALRHGSKGEVEFAVRDEPPAAVVTIRGVAEGVLTGETPGEALDRLDLASCASSSTASRPATSTARRPFASAPPRARTRGSRASTSSSSSSRP